MYSSAPRLSTNSCEATTKNNSDREDNSDLRTVQVWDDVASHSIDDFDLLPVRYSVCVYWNAASAPSLDAHKKPNDHSSNKLFR